MNNNIASTVMGLGLVGRNDFFKATVRFLISSSDVDKFVYCFIIRHKKKKKGKEKIAGRLKTTSRNRTLIVEGKFTAPRILDYSELMQ